MPLKTWMGGSSAVASNFLEGSVPVNGDDVYVHPSATDCFFASNMPGSGQIRSFIVDNNFNNKINLNGKILHLWNVGFDGIGFDAGLNSKWEDSVGTGYIYFYPRANSSNPNFNRVIANNNTMSNISVFFNTSSVYFVLASDFYCKDFTLNSTSSNIYITPHTSILYNVYIYGDAKFSTNMPGSIYWGQLVGLYSFQNVSLMGENKMLYGSFAPRNISSNIPTFNINKYYIPTNFHFAYYNQNNTNNWAPIIINRVTSNDINSNFFIINAKNGYLNFGVEVSIDEIDNLILNPTLTGGKVRIKKLKVNKKLHIISNCFYSDGNILSTFEPNNVVIELTPEASFFSYYTSFKNITFSKPVTGINCSTINSYNYKNTPFPYVVKNIF